MKDKEIDKETKEIRLQEKDPLFSLKTVLFEFFKKRLTIIQEEDLFRNRIKDAILERIENNDVTIAQLITLYGEISNENTFATNSILDIFKPSKDGSVSPIVQSNKPEDSATSSISDFDPLSPEDAEALQTLGGIIDKIKRQKK